MTDPLAAPVPEETSASLPPYPITPVPRRSRLLGRVVLVAGLALFGLSIGVSIAMGIAAAPYATVTETGFSADFSAADPDPAVRALAIVSIAHVVVGGLIGTWVIVQGIVAIATNRGRAEGVVALILGIVTPGISLGVYLGVLLSTLPR